MAVKGVREVLRSVGGSGLEFPATPKTSEECSAQVAINLIHGKWKTRILSRLQRGPARLREAISAAPACIDDHYIGEATQKDISVPRPPIVRTKATAHTTVFPSAERN